MTRFKYGRLLLATGLALAAMTPVAFSEERVIGLEELQDQPMLTAQLMQNPLAGAAKSMTLEERVNAAEALRAAKGAPLTLQELNEVGLPLVCRTEEWQSRFLPPRLARYVIHSGSC